MRDPQSFTCSNIDLWTLGNKQIWIKNIMIFIFKKIVSKNACNEACHVLVLLVPGWDFKVFGVAKWCKMQKKSKWGRGPTSSWQKRNLHFLANLSYMPKFKVWLWFAIIHFFSFKCNHMSAYVSHFIGLSNAYPKSYLDQQQCNHQYDQTRYYWPLEVGINQ